MFVLAIDTSSPAVTAGVVTVRGAEVEGAEVEGAEVEGAEVVLVAERAALAARGHGELLAPSIEAVLHDAGIGPAELAAIVVGTGPGPFTGLRVGLVTAAVFAELLGVAAYGVCSLDAIGDSGRDEPVLLVATDARRREVYWARYEHGRRAGEPGVDRPGEVPLDGVTAVAGAGSELYAEVWPGLPRRPERYPDPVALVRLALDRITGGAPADPLTPLYLRRPDAVEPSVRKAVGR